MRLLFQSDTQVDFNNLQESETSLEELLASAAKYRPDAIIHAGDVKDAYSPIDALVLKFCVRMVRRIREAGHRYIILLGNHDRISQSTESKNWLDVLQAAGAEIVTRPKVKNVAGALVAFLPYMSAQEDLTKAAMGLSRAVAGHSGPKILVFHAEIAGSVINASGRLGKGPSAEDLGFENYTACFGGHIHAHQKIAENGWYIGSPFCQDWGEADSRKGHLLVDTISVTESDMPLQSDPLPDYIVQARQLVTKIPHWYNVGYLEKNKIQPEPNAYIRSRVRVSTKKISDQLRDEEARIRKAYGNVRIHTIPELIDDSGVEVVLKGSSDKEKVEQYVAASLSDEARFEAGQITAYMVSKLDGLKESAVGSAIRFVGVEADNVLVLEHVKLKLAKLGLVLIRGVNENWPGRSNGSGKSSLLSLIPIAMFGQTGKGQKSDAWAYERNSDPATVQLILRDAQDRKIEIGRGRRPHSIWMKIDGEDKSVGLRGTGKKETQGLIEQVTGYDLQTLMNAIYIDQSIANGFVFGTPSARMDLIARFQNLERFSNAQDAVAKDIKKCDAALSLISLQIDSLTSEIDDLKADLKDLDSRAETHWEEELRQERAKLDNLIEQHAAIAATSQAYEELARTIGDLESDRKVAQQSFDSQTHAAHVYRDRSASGERLLEAGKCPTCSQPTGKVGKSIVDAAKAALADSTASVSKLRTSLEGINAKLKAANLRMQRYESSLEETADAIDSSRERIADLEKAAGEEAERNNTLEARTKHKQAECRLKQRFFQASIDLRQTLSIDRELLEFAKKAFHRSGIPLYLSMALCPLLNKAAEEYSEIFTDGNLKVVFRVEDSEFAVDVINPAGSSTVDGQSVGESSMAGIITAFALREAAPKTNLLVLDEPGIGLDAEGCRQFAQGILKLKDRFETILLVTHSAYIASILSGETVYTVRKKDGRSRLYLN